MLILLFILSLVLIIVVWQRRNERKQRRLVLRQLRGWLGAQGTIDPTLQRWVNSLSIREADVLLDLLTGYCTSLNWELAWLFTPQLQKVPLLKQAIEESVIAYARSILTSLQLMEDVFAYNAYIGLLQKPTGRNQFALIQKLYQALGEQSVIKPITKKQTWFRRQPTRKQKIAAVVDAFENKPMPAMTTLKALLVMEAVADVQEMASMAFRAAQATAVNAVT